MTVSSETNSAGPYQGNGVTTVFPYEFRIIDETHVQVIKRLVSGAETVLTLGVHYTVSGVGGQTGSITILVPPAVGEVVKILRKVPFKQETALENQGAYFPDVVEAAFDLAAMRDQQLQEQIDRTVKIPASADPEELNALIADVLRLSASADALDTVAAIAPQVVQVAAIDDEVVNVSDIRAAVVTVAGIRDEVVTVAGVAPAVQAVKDNLVDVQNAAENALEAKSARDLALQYRNEAEEFSDLLNPENMLHINASQALTTAQKGWAVANLDLASITGDRNLLTNASLIFITYGSKTIAAGASDFVFDRWIITNNTNQPVTVSQVLAPLGSITSIPGNPRAKMRLAWATAPTTGTVIIRQRIENVHSLADSVASARAYFKGPVGNESLGCQITQHFGSGGSPSSPVTTASSSQDINTIYNAGTELRRAQFVVPPLTGKTLGTSGGDYLELAWVLTPRQTGPYEVARMSFVRGDAFYENDPFTQRLMATDRMHCLRYAETLLVYMRYYSAGAGHIQNIVVPWFPKRTVPTATFLGLGAGANLSSYGWADISADNGGRFEVVAASSTDTFALQATYRMTAEL